MFRTKQEKRFCYAWPKSCQVCQLKFCPKDKLLQFMHLQAYIMLWIARSVKSRKRDSKMVMQLSKPLPKFTTNCEIYTNLYNIGQKHDYGCKPSNISHAVAKFSQVIVKLPTWVYVQ